MRVVVDTNVFVSSFFGGIPRKIVDLWKKGQITLCLSRPIVEEYVEVLGRLGLQNEIELKELMGLFAQGPNILFSASTPRLKIVDQDPDDDKFIECAVALNATYVVSGDKSLLGVGAYMGISIVTPRQFIDAFNQ
jgi:uncharacterized protein